MIRALVILIVCVSAACHARGTNVSDAAPSAPSEAGTSSPISDARIGSAFDDARAFDPMLRSTSVRAAIVHGDVTLTGAVTTLTARRRAEELVDIFKGVRSVVDDTVVNVPSRPDADIAKDVAAAIHGDPATRNASVHVTSEGQVVSLRGDVDSSTQRELLLELASRILGVRDVKMIVQIRGTRGANEIAADIDERFRDDARVDGPPIAVTIDGRAVTLSGVVGSLAQRNAIISDAWVSGVASVDADHVRVDWNEWLRAREASGNRPHPTDARIATAVTRALSDDGRVGMPLPTIAVDHGIVALSGNVMDFRAARIAARVATRARGVQSVEDRMTVAPAHDEDDATIQKQAEQNVYNDVAGNDTRSVQITTAHAKVTVQGHVASQEEKIAIDGDIEQVPGVVAIEDDLRVGGSATQATPAAIEHRARENIFLDARVPSATVTVTVAPNGDATLGGVVDERSEARAANDDVVRAGAAHVISLIRVKP
jgi:osmotically-inducible protein OsmY